MAKKKTINKKKDLRSKEYETIISQIIITNLGVLRKHRLINETGMNDSKKMEMALNAVITLSDHIDSVNELCRDLNKEVEQLRERLAN